MLFKTTVTARCGETDALGHINNTSYFIYMEEARIKFFQYLGFGMDIKDWRFILASTTCDYIAQGYFNDEIEVTAEVAEIGTKSFHLMHRMINRKTGKLIAKGKAVIVYFNFDKQVSEALPELLKSELSRHQPAPE
ncbi:acyl-CoA thioesterase [Heyndrickxia acidicola]|uniref:Acyl-CoA thioesterase n=1 Tax=Heyndrickxia acidicola TaxID=209389 RepID=A0ABU6MK85_9BACI|nr:acyl-CoA thioesterase [Heyndrickxia acidicola]MED1204058.1 acyl-CoA thioesterase [Heyndrickxia acidicola]